MVSGCGADTLLPVLEGNRAYCGGDLSNWMDLRLTFIDYFPWTMVNPGRTSCDCNPH